LAGCKNFVISVNYSTRNKKTKKYIYKEEPETNKLHCPLSPVQVQDPPG